jgi:hypothetical protein
MRTSSRSRSRRTARPPPTSRTARCTRRAGRFPEPRRPSCVSSGTRANWRSRSAGATSLGTVPGDDDTVRLRIDGDGPASAAFARIPEIAFDATGERVAFIGVATTADGLSGTATVFVRALGGGGGGESAERRPGASPDRPLRAGFSEIRHLVFGPSGRLAYTGRTEAGWHAVSGDHVSEGFDEVGPPLFSEDGSSLTFGARRGLELWWRTLELADGEAGEAGR